MAELVTGVASFRADAPWDGPTIARIGNAEAMLIWADRPYHWHVNRSDELFCVVNGRVDMHYRSGGVEQRKWLDTGDMIVVRKGEEHVAYPEGEARFLIVAAPPEQG